MAMAVLRIVDGRVAAARLGVGAPPIVRFAYPRLKPL